MGVLTFVYNNKVIQHAKSSLGYLLNHNPKFSLVIGPHRLEGSRRTLDGES